jgi:hypothetical protein
LIIAFYDYEKKCLNSDGQQFHLDINKANIYHFSIYLMEHLKFMTQCYIHYKRRFTFPQIGITFMEKNITFP